MIPNRVSKSPIETQSEHNMSAIRHSLRSLRFSKNYNTDIDRSSESSARLVYKPLIKSKSAKSEIRILKIESTSKHGPLQCTLKHTTCDSEYTALSYCWGDPNGTLPITVNGCTMHVTRNLDAALRELRSQNFTYVWVDALCINQDDEDERSEQVLRMKEIYSSADHTVAWLGPDDDEIAESAFACMRLLQSENPKDVFLDVVRSIEKWLPCSEPDNPGLAALRRMIYLPYWRRTWIIQELIRARYLRFAWGQSSIEAHMVKSGIQILRDHKPPISFDGWGPVLGIILIMDASDNKNDLDNRAALMDLQHTLTNSCSSQATDPRDKIFGILGVCSDGPKLIPSPNYHQSLDQVLRELRIAQLRQTPVRRHRRAARPTDLICLDYPLDPKRPNFSSWVTDWQAFWRHPSARGSSRTSMRGMNSGYLACGKSEYAVKLSEDCNVLIARGFVFDSIRQLSPSIQRRKRSHASSPPQPDTEYALKTTPYRTITDTYEAIWRTLVMDRRRWDKDVAPPDYGLYFASLYSKDSEILRAQKSDAVQITLDLVRDFSIHGRTLQQWAQLDHSLLVNDYAEQVAREIQSRTKKDSYGTQIFKSSARDFIMDIHLGTTYTRFMATEDGYVGLGHCQSEVGDSICLLQGCTMPVILRPCEVGYRVVGECYVHGIMDGEFWRTQDDSTMQEFHLK